MDIGPVAAGQNGFPINAARHVVSPAPKYGNKGKPYDKKKWAGIGLVIFGTLCLGLVVAVPLAGQAIESKKQRSNADMMKPLSNLTKKVQDSELIGAENSVYDGGGKVVPPRTDTLSTVTLNTDVQSEETQSNYTPNTGTSEATSEVTSDTDESIAVVATTGQNQLELEPKKTSTTVNRITEPKKTAKPAIQSSIQSDAKNEAVAPENITKKLTAAESRKKYGDFDPSKFKHYTESVSAYFLDAPGGDYTLYVNPIEIIQSKQDLNEVVKYLKFKTRYFWSTIMADNKKKLNVIIDFNKLSLIQLKNYADGIRLLTNCIDYPPERTRTASTWIVRTPSSFGWAAITAAARADTPKGVKKPTVLTVKDTINKLPLPNKFRPSALGGDIPKRNSSENEINGSVFQAIQC